MTDNLDKTMDKIKKLLRVAEGGANENESATALELAQQLADAYNIDIAGINTKPGARDDQIFPGGLYPWQRKLYKAIAELNHCLYWSRKGIERGEKYKHRVVGSKVNVILTRQMADYLQSAIERIARDHYGNIASLYFKKDAHIYREGMADRIIERLEAKRRAEEAQAAQAKREAQARGDGTSLVMIDDVKERERIANYDFQHGEGAWARFVMRQENSRVEYEARQKAAEEKLEAFKRDHPEEWAKQEAEKEAENAKWAREYEKQQKAREARRQKTGYYDRLYRANKKDEKYYSTAYQQGRSRADDVSLADQIDETKKKSLT